MRLTRIITVMAANAVDRTQWVVLTRIVSPTAIVQAEVVAQLLSSDGGWSGTKDGKNGERVKNGEHVKGRVYPNGCVAA
jgi:hypothetical protein